MATTGAIDDLEAAMKDYLDAEEKRLTDEATFLQKIYDAVTTGAAVESASTKATDAILAETLSIYLTS